MFIALEMYHINFLNYVKKGGDELRGERLGRKMRGSSSGKYFGRTDLCDKEPGERPCLEQLYGPKNDICRNCQAEAVQTEKIKVFSEQKNIKAPGKMSGRKRG